MKEQPLINWDYSGKPDLAFGNGATRSEQTIATVAGFFIPLAILWMGLTGVIHWTWWQYLIAVLMGMDMGSGMVANMLNSGKRFYHTPIKEDEIKIRFLKNKIGFTAMHIYPILGGLLFGQVDWLYAFGWYLLLILSAVIVTRVPLYLRRPTATFIVLLSIIGNLYFLPAPIGLEWLVPVLFIKIILAHLVQEEPYRPAV